MLALWLLLVASCASSSQPVEVLAEPMIRPGDPAVTVDGRLIFSQHPLDAPDWQVVELLDNGEIVPFPTPSWSRDRLGAVIGIEARSDGLVWILDMGGKGITPKLIAWDSVRGSLAHQIQIPETVRVDSSYLQDLAIIEKYGVAVIADMTLPEPFGTPEPALIVVDIETGLARRVLQGDPSFLPTVNSITIGDARVERLTAGGDLRALQLSLNPITVDPSQDWIYYGAASGHRIYRLPTAALADPELSPDELRATIETYAQKAPSNGIRVDGQGRVFVTDVQASGIGLATPTGYEVLLSDPDLFPWPDGLAFDRSGALIVTVNQLHRHPELNGGDDESKPPYKILRLNEWKALR